MPVFDSGRSKDRGQRLDIELRIMAGPRHGPQVGKQFYFMQKKQLDQFFYISSRVATV